jgi:hypothetical protein
VLRHRLTWVLQWMRVPALRRSTVVRQVQRRLRPEFRRQSPQHLLAVVPPVFSSFFADRIRALPVHEPG